ncbi:hypothetical protein FQN50_007382 [Emmonsiellopsis sp. PD_5]|nr:hypothetical protein FQN50_007382 [Emmonsiellopsis sp. PD_5]
MASPSSTVAVDRLFESFIPGFSVASRIASSLFHIDLSEYLSYVIGVAAAFLALRYVSDNASWFIWRHFACNAEISVEDEVYSYVMYWLGRQSFSNNTPNFTAATKTEYDYISRFRDRGSNNKKEYDSDIGSDEDFDEYWERTNRRDRTRQVNYTPSVGDHYFRYKGRFIRLTRRREKVNAFTFLDNVSISCLGRDPSFLKELIDDAQQAYISRDGNKTIIYRSAKGSKGEDSTIWQRCMARHPRAMSTVVLDTSQKEDFMKDVKDYLHPLTKRWYANRGIPYRRGYLFHGPPGCGKTSLGFAAAGDLGLKIYIISLNSRTLTEEGLASLFTSLPQRCIVLLEDIDTAGVTTNNRTDNFATPSSDAPKSNPAMNEGKPSKPTDQQRPPISLSGLLNTIDGVASSEGRILIMTTNHIENLDPALLRPGRVDMAIRFEYANADVIHNMFRGVYTKLEGDIKYSTRPRHRRAGAKKQPTSSSSSAAAASSSLESKSHPTPSTTDKQQTQPLHRSTIHQHSFSPEMISSLAADFASRVPADKFTPAEIQGYLLKHKFSPEQAVAGAEEWARDFCRPGEKKGVNGVEGGGNGDGESGVKVNGVSLKAGGS